MTTLNQQTAIQQLKASTTATRLTFHWLGVTCKMEEEQKERMASVVEADCDSLAVSKKLYNNKLPVLKEIAKVKGRIKQHWEHVTLPYVEAGIRLLKRTTLTAFHERMSEFQEELASAAQEVQKQRVAVLADPWSRLKLQLLQGLHGRLNDAALALLLFEVAEQARKAHTGVLQQHPQLVGLLDEFVDAISRMTIDAQRKDRRTSTSGNEKYCA
jgi:hypothetical protein